MIIPTDELLGKELDRKGNEIFIYFTRQENMSTDLAVFFIRQCADLLENGHAINNHIPRITGSRIIFAVHGNKIIGLRIWAWEANNTRIILSSVDKEYRRLGILTILNRYYDLRISSSDCRSSCTFIHKDNIPMLEAAKKTGYEIELVKMVKKY